MKRILLLLLLATALHAAGPVRMAFDSKVADWDYRCVTNNPFSRGLDPTYPGLRIALNLTQSKLASSVWMGYMRTAGQYPGILRANLACGGSYGGTNGCGDCLTPGCVNIGSPQIPLINDFGGAMDVITVLQGRWKYAETGANGGLGCVSTNNYVYLDTGLIPSMISWSNDAHLAIYLMGDPLHGVTINIVIGTVHLAGGGVNQCAMTATYLGLQAGALWTYVGQPTIADTNGAGLYLLTRTSSATNGVQQFKNQSATGTSTSVGGNLATLTNSIFVLAYNNGGTGALGQTANLTGGYAIGLGVTASVATNGYYTAWQEAEKILTRQK